MVDIARGMPGIHPTSAIAAESAHETAPIAAHGTVATSDAPQPEASQHAGHDGPDPGSTALTRSEFQSRFDRQFHRLNAYLADRIPAEPRRRRVVAQVFIACADLLSLDRDERKVAWALKRAADRLLQIEL